MNEIYLCENCKHCYLFFAMYCSITDKECPPSCVECEHYMKTEDDYAIIK